MSVPYDRAYELLSNSQNGHVSASERIPVIARPFVSERAKKTLDLVSFAAIPLLSALGDSSSLLLPLRVSRHHCRHTNCWITGRALR